MRAAQRHSHLANLKDKRVPASQKKQTLTVVHRLTRRAQKRARRKMIARSVLIGHHIDDVDAAASAAPRMVLRNSAAKKSVPNAHPNDRPRPGEERLPGPWRRQERGDLSCEEAASKADAAFLYEVAALPDRG